MAAVQNDASTTTTMKEIPFLQHHPLLPLPIAKNGSSIVSGSISSAASAGRKAPPPRVVIASVNNHDGVFSANGAAIGVILTEQQQRTSAEENRNDSTSLIPFDNDNNNNNGNYNDTATTTTQQRQFHNTIMDTHEESYTLRGLSSIYYSKSDNRMICTNGIAGQPGKLCISVRNAAGGGREDDGDDRKACRDLEVDLSSLMNEKMGGGGSSALFESPVGTACFVTHSNNYDDAPGDEDENNMDTMESSSMQSSYLHLRTVDPYGTVLSLTFSYPDLIPIANHSPSTPKSFLLPLSPKGNHVLPHPGSSIEINQVCFPTPSTVVFALNPHLYCVDFGNNTGSSEGGGVVTRVWTSIHHVVSDPILANATAREEANHGVAAGTTPRKKARKSTFGSMLTQATYTLMGMADHDGSEEYEYHDDDDEEGDGYHGGMGGSMIPSIAALANLSSLTTDDSNGSGGSVNVARVSTLHSDGSLRLWTAEPSQKASTQEKQLRIPSVQRIAIPQGNNSWVNSEVQYVDPPIPHSSTWDPSCRSGDGLTLCGYCKYDPRSEVYSYEVALYVQCYSNGRNDKEGGSVYVFQGFIVDPMGADDVGRNQGGDAARMQELVLPNGTRSVVDVSWSGGNGDLMVLLRQTANNAGEEEETFYTIGEGEDAKVALAVYPMERQSLYSKDAVMPFNMTLPQLDLNHSGYSSLGLSVEEELDRYMSFTGDETSSSEDSNDMETTDTVNPSAASIIAKAEAKLDKAGLLAILQPFGRCRPSALAVHRAMSTLGLLEDDETASSGIRPVEILLAMRKWKKRMAFSQSSCTSLVVVNDNESQEMTMGGANNSPMPSSIYHAFASATKNATAKERTTRWNDEEDATSGVTTVEAARQAHRSRWVRLVSEICRQETRLDEVLCLGMMAASSPTNFLVRGSRISVVTVDDDPTGDATLREQQGGETMAGLDELSMELLECIMSNPELRQLLCRVESMLYDGASKASSLVDADKHSNIDLLLSQVELLGRSVMAMVALDDAQFQLVSDSSQLGSDFSEAWLASPVSASSSVSTQLAISKTATTMPNNSAATNTGEGSCEAGALSSAAASLIAGRLESSRQLSLSRLILVVGSPQQQQGSRNHSLIQRHSALRSVLYSTALCWAIHQPSSIEKQLTVLEEHLTHEVTVTKGDSFHSNGMTAALALADTFIASAFSYYNDNETLGGDIISPSREPRVALRLLAPLVEFPSSHSISPPWDVTHQKRREVAAECLLAEATAIAKQAESNAASNETSPETLWGLASNLLLLSTDISLGSTEDSSQIISNLIHRVGMLERHLNSIEGSETYLPLCCGVVLDAIQDAISAIMESSPMSREMMATMEEIPTLWLMAFQTSMRGHLWDEALRACVHHNPLTADGKKTNTNLKHLILGMVDAGALGKIVDMSLTVRELPTSMLGDDEGGDNAEDTATTGVDLFDLADKIIEEAAFEQASISLGGSETGGSVVKEDRPNYWGCLYTLHASRGNWRQAAYAMDMCGKATANSVSSTKLVSQQIVLSKAVSKKIMDDASLSAQACVHAISLVDKASQRYLLPTTTGNHDHIPSESRLLTEDDLERRATRALALRMYSMDEYSPDSVGTILKSTSRDTIDSLAMLGYYDQAIAVAAGVSSKRKGCLPGGVDLFDDALKYILCTYLVPAATKSHVTIDGGDGCLERSKIAQIRASSSACLLLGSANTPPQSCITSSCVNSKSWVSNGQSGKALQATMAMDLLQQYTTVYSKRCRGLALSAASAILQLGDGISELPLWLKELCIFGVIPGDEESSSGQNGLFAHPTTSKDNGIADPAGLMRLFIKHDQYGEACEVVVSILSKQTSHSKNAPSSRLPEKGSIDYVPYDLIDMLWNMIESIIASSTTAAHSNSYEDVKSQIKSLIKKRSRMENALEKHFESLRISEEGLQSARRLSCA